MTETVQKYKHYLQQPSSKKQGKKVCPNCGTLHEGNYCHNCGQSADSANKPFKDALFDLLGSLYAFDLRFWHSIKLMFTRPGHLSEEYLNGKIASNAPPFKLYFFVSFVFFFIVNWATDSAFEKNNATEGLINSASVFNPSGATDSTGSDSILTNSTFTSEYTFDSIKTEVLKEMKTSESDSTELSKQIDSHEKKISSIMRTTQGQKIFIHQLFKVLSWMLVILMPVFALILNLLYIRRGYYYIKHLVFAVNIHTQIFLILVLFILVDYLLGDLSTNIQAFILLYAPFYLIFGMKRYYKQRWRKTIAKFFISLILKYS